MVETRQLLAPLPVIGTRHGGIPYAIPEDFREELVAEGDIGGLARQIRELNQLSGAELQERAQIGRRFVLDRFENGSSMHQKISLTSVSVRCVHRG